MYEIGQKITGKYPKDLSDWCNQNNAYLDCEGLVLNEKNEYVYDNAVWTIKKRPEPTYQEQAERIRAERDEKLEATDKFMMIDFPISEEERKEVIEYRHALRNLPASAGFPENVVFPEEPEVVSKSNTKRKIL